MAYDFMVLMVCLNIAIFLTNAMISAGILGITYTSAYQASNPATMPFTQAVSDLTGFVGTFGTTLAVSGVMAVISLLSGKNLLGFGFVTLFALSFFLTPLNWIFGGAGSILACFNLPIYITASVMGIQAFIEIVFLLEFIGQRDVT